MLSVRALSTSRECRLALLSSSLVSVARGRGADGGDLVGR